jgi:hypothetical protein
MEDPSIDDYFMCAILDIRRRKEPKRSSALVGYTSIDVALILDGSTYLRCNEAHTLEKNIIFQTVDYENTHFHNVDVVQSC